MPAVMATHPPTPTDGPTASSDERAQAARAHLSAWLGLLPLFGVFASAGIYGRNVSASPWVAQQALQSSLFQIVTFNLLLIVVAAVAPVSFFAWESKHDGASLALAIFLTILPFIVVYYAAQGLAATRAARAVRRGEDFRYPFLGRLVGDPALTAHQRRVTGSATDDADQEHH